MVSLISLAEGLLRSLSVTLLVSHRVWCLSRGSQLEASGLAERNGPAESIATDSRPDND